MEPPAADPHRRPAFVGRDAELAALSNAWHDARRTGPVVVLIGGEAGIGKSRLVAEFAARVAAPDGARVLTGACLELGGGGLPYAPFVTVLRRLVQALGPDRAAALLPAGGRRGLAHWLPELGEPAEAGPGPDSGYARARLFDEVLTLLEAAAADAPLLLVLEDLHWADDSSRHLLTYLAHNLTRPGVLLLATHRSTDLPDDHPLRPLLAELSRTAAPSPIRSLDLAPLPRDDVARLLADRLPAPPTAGQVTEIYRRTDGNPLFVEALADAGDAARGTPARLRDLLLAAFRDLPDPTLAALRAAAVAGDRPTHALLSTVTGLPGTALDDALRPAVTRHLLLPDGPAYRFRHTLYRTALYDSLLPGERTHLHRRYAESLTDPATSPAVLPGSGAAVDRVDVAAASWQVAAEVAAHWYAAGDAAQALSSAWRAAAAAGAGYAYAEQAQLLERVLALWPTVPDAATRTADRATVLHRAAQAHLDAGTPTGGLPLTTEAVAATTDPHHTALILETRSLLQHRLGDDGLPALHQALTLLPPTTPTNPAGPANPPGPKDTCGPGDTSGHLAISDQAETTARQDVSGTSVRGRVLATLASRMSVLSRRPEATRLAAEALREGEAAGDAGVRALALATLAAGDAASGETEAALARCAQARELAGAVGADDTLLLVAVTEAVAWKAAGDYERACAVVRDGLGGAHRVGRAGNRGAVLAGVLADGLYELGRWDEARTLLGDTLALDPPPLYRAVLLTTVGAIAAAQGDLPTARHAATEAAALLGTRYQGPEFVLPLRALECQLAADRGVGAPALAMGTAVADVGQIVDGVLADPDLAEHAALVWPVLSTAAGIWRAVRDPRLRDEAARRLAEVSVVADRLVATGTVQAAHRAMVLAAIGNTMADWEVAAAAWRALDHPYRLAMALAGGVEASLAAGDRATAGTTLREAAALAADLGAAPLAGELALLATRARLPLPTPPIPSSTTPAAPAPATTTPATSAGVGGDGGLGLTGREVEVLRLVAAGRRNREIGVELFISAKTAGVHVSNILAKLGVGSRTEAAAVAHQLRLFG